MTLLKTLLEVFSYDIDPFIKWIGKLRDPAIRLTSILKDINKISRRGSESC